MKKYKYYGVSLCTGLLGFHTLTSCVNTGKELGWKPWKTVATVTSGVVGTGLIVGTGLLVANQKDPNNHALSPNNNTNASNSAPFTTANPNLPYNSCDNQWTPNPSHFINIYGLSKCLKDLGDPPLQLDILPGKTPGDMYIDKKTQKFLKKNHYSPISVLHMIEKGQHVNAQNTYGETIMLTLLKEFNKGNVDKSYLKNYLKMVKCFLDNGANPYIGNKQGENVISLIDSLLLKDYEFFIKDYELLKCSLQNAMKNYTMHNTLKKNKKRSIKNP